MELQTNFFSDFRCLINSLFEAEPGFTGFVVCTRTSHYMCQLCEPIRRRVGCSFKDNLIAQTKLPPRGAQEEGGVGVSKRVIIFIKGFGCCSGRVISALNTFKWLNAVVAIYIRGEFGPSLTLGPC